MSKSIYKEVQRYRRWEVISLLLILLAWTSYHFIELYLYGGYSEKLLILQYSLIFIVLSGALIYLWSIRLILQVKKDGLFYQFYPLHYRKQKVKWSIIEELEIIDTPMMAELSGWSIRLGTSERMFSVSGRTGLSLSLKNGRHLFIGSKEPEKLKAAIEKARSQE